MTAALNSKLTERRSAALSRGVGTMTGIYAERASNAEIWDVEGRRYIDFASGIAVVNTGHCHPRIIEAARAQLDRFTHTCHQVVPYENYVALAERLNALVPGPGEKKTVFLTTGAEAVENAVKIARAATGRSAVIAFSGGFHGRTFMGMSLTGKVSPYKAGFGAMSGDVYHAPFPVPAARHYGRGFACRTRADPEERRRSGTGRGDHPGARAGRRRVLSRAAGVHDGVAKPVRPVRHAADR